MKYGRLTRRTMLGLMGIPIDRGWGQGVSTRGVKAQPRGKPSGLPLNACFTDIGSQAGLKAPLIYCPADHKTYIVETVGCGCAFVDYDNDGWVDIFLLSGTRLEGSPEGDANSRDFDVIKVIKPGASGYCNCYGIHVNGGPRNLPHGAVSHYHNHYDGKFTQVSIQSGMSKATSSYCMTKVAADYDNHEWY